MVADLGHSQDVPGCNSDSYEPEEVEYCASQRQQRNVIAANVECPPIQAQCRHSSAVLTMDGMLLSVTKWLALF